MENLKIILEEFAKSGWDLISIPSQNYLNGTGSKEDLINAIQQANNECGNCGCSFDSLYKKCLELLHVL